MFKTKCNLKSICKQSINTLHTEFVIPEQIKKTA